MKSAGCGGVVDLQYPFTGRWLVQNSPANRVPSHGTTLFATSYAIDFVPVGDTHLTAPVTFGTLLRPEPPEKFPGFGRPVLAPADGAVVAVHDSEPDHAAYRGLPSLRYALTQSRRVAAGWTALAGNYVVLESGGAFIVLCHLQQGSVKPSAGQRVRAGELLGRCGYSGNSTEPHLHIQAINTPDIERASAVQMRFKGSLPRNGQIVEIGEQARAI